MKKHQIVQIKILKEIKMNLQLVSCEDQYKLDTRLDRNDVLELQQWQKSQPHLPNITG